MTDSEDIALLKQQFLDHLVRSHAIVNDELTKMAESAQRQAEAHNELAQMIRDAPDLDTLIDQLWDKAFRSLG